MFLRRNLVCFYCGRRSSQKKTAGIREWRCNSCEAVNYLDEHGSPTDPPVQNNTRSLPRYAGRGESVTSPELGPPTESIFCNTCLKNQYLLAHNLAEYLPEPDDPRYSEYERNLPGYRTSLEARYPPVCAECEPRVRARLRRTGYAAKTDHLRRLAEITKNNRRDVSRSKSLETLIVVASLGWWLAHLMQVTWHVVELSRLLPSEEHILTRSETFSSSWSHFLMRIQSIIPLKGDLNSVALGSLALTFFSIWWNPALVRSSWKRIDGLKEFYRLQGILLLSRFLAWRLLSGDNLQSMNGSMRTAAHGIACMLNIFVSIASYRTVRVRLPPRIAFETGGVPLQPNLQPQQGQSEQAPSKNTFPIEKLDSRKAASVTFSEPPTPLLEDSSDDGQTIATTTADSDAMDIDTPERPQISWTPRKLPSVSNTSTPAPSPFHGHLPPAPVSQAHRLRNPPNRPSFRKTSESRQKAFSESMHRKPANEEQSGGAMTGSGSGDIQFAPPRFFAGKQEDTGLESLFSGLVSLDDEPSELRHTSANEQVPIPSYPSSSFATIWAVLEVVLILLAVVEITFDHKRRALKGYLRILVLIAIALDSIVHLRDRLSPGRPVWLLSDLLFYTGELLTAVCLLVVASQTRLEEPLGNTSFNDNEIILFWIFTLQKLSRNAGPLFSHFRSLDTRATREPHSEASGPHKS